MLFTHKYILDDTISITDPFPKILLGKATMAKASSLFSAKLAEGSMCNISGQWSEIRNFSCCLITTLGKNVFVLKYKQYVSYQLQLTE